MPATSAVNAAASAAKPTGVRVRRSRSSTSGTSGRAGASVAAMGQHRLFVVAEAGRRQRLGLLAVDDAREAIAGGEDEVERRRGEPQAGLDGTPPGARGGGRRAH